jgi:hypothetical protein
MWIVFATIVIIGAAVALLTACSNYRHRQWQPQAPSSDSSPVTLRFIEFDDEGWLWQPNIAEETVELIKQSAATKNTVVVTFIHGWHHSAQSGDTNLEDFRRTLNLIHERITTPQHREFVEKSTTRKAAGKDLHVIGIYVGWRGRSLPGLLDYATFWGRKSAAERVGTTDFREFLQRLQKVYLTYHPEKHPINAQAQQATPENFLGMVTIGHSFGAQVLIRAVASQLESQLVSLNGRSGYLRGSAPTQATSDPVELDGIGDLIILVNPATEASQYQRLHVLAQSLRYQPTQTPVILTVSAKTDYPRHRLFAFGRVLGEIFTGKPRKADLTERVVERQALGVFADHITHELTTTGGSDSLTSQDSRQNRDKVAAYDFSRATFSGVSLRQTASAKAIPYQPLIVAEASDDIIKGHNGIFTTPFINFLVPYVTFVETKIYFNLP